MSMFSRSKRKHHCLLGQSVTGCSTETSAQIHLNNLKRLDLAVLTGLGSFLFWFPTLTVQQDLGRQQMQFPAISAQRIPRDELFDQQQNPLKEIELERAWDISTGSNEIIIAVIDDAIDINHPDLRDNMVPGWDFVDGDDDPSPGVCVDLITQENVYESHGTAVAGILGAVGDNHTGISGINWNVRIMPLRIGCHFSANYEAQAVAYAIDHGAHIINASYGGPDAIARNQRVIDLLAQAKSQVLFVTSAGNSHVDNDEIVAYPGGLGLPNQVTVAASSNYQLTEWAQYGVSSVDLAAPGVNLFTTMLSSVNAEKYASVSGSSFSTAIVSGISALILSRYTQNNLSLPKPSDIKAILQASVSPLRGQSARLKTDGVVNASDALTIFQQPRPVVTIRGIKYDDSNSENANDWLDPLEKGQLNIELENFWDDIISGQIELTVFDKELNVFNTTQALEKTLAEGQLQLYFPIETGNFIGNKEFVFKLTINVAGKQANAVYERNFLLKTGVLQNKTDLALRIQRNEFDDYQYYHLNVPANAEHIAVEMNYSPGDSRVPGVLASMNEKPLIHFRPYNGRRFWYRAEAISNQQTGFDRLEMKIPGLKASTLNVLLFNQPDSDLDSTFQNNKPITLKACYYSDFDGNLAPLVDAGSDRVVEAGDHIVLEGKVSDKDGQIKRFYWSTSDDIELDNYDQLKTGFTAPITGEFRFTLSAIDDGCKKTTDSVVIKIRNDADQSSGLLINPRNIIVEENSNIDVQLQANYLSQAINNLTLVYAPDALIFEKSSDSRSGGRLIWQNAGPVGDYIVTFSTEIEGKTLLSSIAINVRTRGSLRSGGGCVISKQNGFDPLFILFTGIALVYIRRNSLKKSI